MASPTLTVMPANRAGLSLVDRIQEVDLISRTLDALEAEGVTPEMEESLTKELFNAITGTKAKIDSVCGVLAAFEAAGAAAQAEMDRLAKRRDHFERQHGRLSAYALAALQLANVKKLEGFTSCLQARLNPPSVAIEDASAVPAEFWRQPPTPAAVPDKTAIKRALAADVPVSGARLVRGYRLERT